MFEFLKNLFKTPLVEDVTLKKRYLIPKDELVSSQGIFDIFNLFDQETVEKIKNIINSIDVNKIKKIMDMIEIDEKGWLKLKIDLGVKK